MLSDYFSEIYLASQSPARYEILKNQGLTVNVCPQNCKEITDRTRPGDVVETLSMMKLDSFLKNAKLGMGSVVLACDTLLWFENRLIGKAKSKDEARDQILMLTGETHKVFSGYAFYYKDKIYHGYDSADVKFRTISDDKLDEYIDSEEWKGAAGSYHLFGKAVDFVESVVGDVNTVIGLPLKKIEKIVEENHE